MESYWNNPLAATQYTPRSPQGFGDCVPKPPSTKYWMVHNGSNPTNHKHTSKDLAIGEAARLARLHPGKKFWVLETVHTAQVPEAPVQHTPL